MRLRRARDDSGFVLFGDVIRKLASPPDGSAVSVSTQIGKFEPGSAIDLPRDAVGLR